MPTFPLVQADDVVAARELLSDVISPTPMLYSRVLSEQVGGPVYLKCENLQRTGSFKVRGAYTRIARLSDAERGVAAWWRRARAITRRAWRSPPALLGALGDRGDAGTRAAAQGRGHPRLTARRSSCTGHRWRTRSTRRCGSPARTGAVFIHPFDHPDIVAGQGTLGFEIIEQCPRVRTIVVPVGGGGLAAGVTVAVQCPRPGGAGRRRAGGGGRRGSSPRSRPGSPSQVVGGPTMADGIAVQRPGDIPFAHPGAASRDRVVTVSEAALARALLLCLERAKQVVEAGRGGRGGGAARPSRATFEPPVVVVLSGGNIDPLLLSKLLRHGLSAAGRFLGFRCRGARSTRARSPRCSGCWPSLGANVLEVSHERLAPLAAGGRGGGRAQVETRGPEDTASTSRRRSAGRGTTWCSAEPRQGCDGQVGGELEDDLAELRIAWSTAGSIASSLIPLSRRRPS